MYVRTYSEQDEGVEVEIEERRNLIRLEIKEKERREET
jgi:hypothetical protein